jgi:transposase
MKEKSKIKFSKVINNQCQYGEKKLFKLRRKVNELYFNLRLSKKKIVKRMGVSKKFVIKWTKSPNQDFLKDNRGWPKGKMRKYTKADEKRIKEIHKELVKDQRTFFAGASAIIQKWQEKYPHLKAPDQRFIGRILKKYHLSEKIQKGKQKGASRYLHYPEYSIFQLGESLLEIDFIGKKFIRGKTEPLNFIAFSLRKP